MINQVSISKRAVSDLKKVPKYIRLNLELWVAAVEADGLQTVRKIPGYHDEPLKGDRAGQRSIRLNKAYRAIYVIKADGSIEFVEILEVNKHEY
jgi:proteic killer suppression protein